MHKVEAARLMVYNAAKLKGAGQTFAKEAAMAQLYSSEVAEEVAPGKITRSRNSSTVAIAARFMKALQT